ncbi:sterol desaturase family protein [Pseudofrancisella aestuarii]|uniref:Sterol desaturase family protein n=1 Tax=Pseudofrancisella aestuarii TaxID=2670347 RepID=A0ABV9TBF5_9GAMM|nr:sterol desaturase family protein [Pseudofrancisella aestuarii]
MPYELTIRLFFFLSILLIMMVWEIIAPRRKQKVSKKIRWVNNISLIIINSIIIRLLFPAAAVGIAIWCSQNHLGLLNALDIPQWLKVIIAFLVLDLAIFLQHVLFHYLPVFWRIHKVHHADLDFDVTTGLRFHPIEIVLSMLIKFMVIIFIGASVESVIIFEIVLNATSMFNHSNIKLSLMIDKYLRYFIITPDMHRIHHSVIPKETNSNFGFNLSLWDRLFATYRANAANDQTTMDIGLSEHRDIVQTQKLLGMIKMPFEDNQDPQN